MKRVWIGLIWIGLVIGACASPAYAAGDGDACPLLSRSPASVGPAAAFAVPAARSGDGIRVPSASDGPYDPQAAARRREDERRLFERILATRPSLPAGAALERSITPQQREAIEQDEGGRRLRVGTALAIGQEVDFSRLDDTGATTVGERAFARGMLRADAAVQTWEIEVATPQASALRLQFSDVHLAPGASLYVYNESGRVAGPYTGKGPDASGAFWSNSVFGDRVRVHLRAHDAASLRASRFTIASAMHLGSRFRVADAVRQRYAVGPSPNGGSFCNTTVPPCTRDGMCALAANPGLENATKGTAYLLFVDGVDTFICTGTVLNTAFDGPTSGASPAAGHPAYLLTANHCIANQASAASVESYFHFHTSSCGGTCDFEDVVEVDGSTLLTTGAAPARPDFTLLRLSPLPVGAGVVRLGWTTETPLEGWYLLRLSHPNGAPLAYSYRRLRLVNGGLPHCTDAPEPAFLYSGLLQQASDADGAVTTGSSGAAALILENDNSDVQVVGQLFGHCPSNGDVCDANADSTIDGSFRAEFPYLRRYLLERVFANGFDSP